MSLDDTHRRMYGDLMTLTFNPLTSKLIRELHVAFPDNFRLSEDW